MSQAKVDRYKEQKANRKQIVKQAKRKKMVGVIASVLVVVAACGWIGHSVYLTFENNKKSEEITVDYSSLDDFYGDIATDDAK